MASAGRSRARQRATRRDRPPRRAPSWLFAGLLIVSAVIAFSNALDTPFVFDDSGTVIENPYVRRLWPIAQAVRAPVQSAVAGRPLVSLSLAINYALSSLDPFGYHVWNLAVHALAALLLMGIVRRTCARPDMPAWIAGRADVMAFATALIWLIHPLQTEVIAYTTQRTEAMMGVFYLLTLYAGIRAMAGGSSGWWTWAAVAACALGMMCKESMVTAPFAVLGYDAVFVAGSITSALRQRRRLYLGLASSWLVLAVLVAPGPRWRSAGFESGVSAWTYLLGQPAMILTYLKRTVWPVSLVLDYGPARLTAIAAAAAPGLVVLILLAVTIIVWWRSRRVGFLLACFWLTLAPTSSILPIATEVGAERRMYLPLAALIVLSVLAVTRLLDRSIADARTRQRVAAAVLASLAAAFVWLTVARNREYASPIGIWETVIARRPHGRAHYNLGLQLMQAGRGDEALTHYRIASEDEPKAFYALALADERRDRLDEAERQYREYLRRLPDDVQAPEAHVRLGIVLTRLERLPEATEVLRRAVEMRPRQADAREAYGMALMSQGRLDDAAAEFDREIELAPGDPRGYEHLGLLRLGQSRPEAAIGPLERAVALSPRDPEMRLALGNALMLAGRLEDAVAQYREGIRLAPDAAGLHAMLGSALGRRGQIVEAVAELERALALGFRDPQLQAEYERLRALSKRVK